MHRCFALHFFTVKNGQIHRWHSITPNGSLSVLDNGALLITTGDYSNGYLIREYSQLDPNATVKFRITYSWYDSNSDRFFDPDDRYVINGREVTKAEYDRAKEQYGDRSTGKIQWYYLTRQTMQSIPLG